MQLIDEVPDTGYDGTIKVYEMARPGGYVIVTIWTAPRSFDDATPRGSVSTVFVPHAEIGGIPEGVG